MANIPLYVTPTGRLRKAALIPEVYSTSDPIEVKRGDQTTFSVAFLSEEASVETTNGPGDSAGDGASALVMVGVKETDKYDADLIVSGNVTGIDANGFYVVELNLNNSSLNTLLNAFDDDEDNDETYVDLMFEVTWSISGGGSGATDWRTSDTVTLRVHNDVIRNTESEAFPLAQHQIWQKGFDDAVVLPTFARRILIDGANQDELTGGYAMEVTSATYNMTDFVVARLNDLVNSKLAYGTGQPADVTDITSTPFLSSSKAVHAWWDGSNWNLHIYEGGAWSAGWTSSEDVAAPQDVVTWTADTTTYPSMTDDLSSVVVSTNVDLQITIPASWDTHGMTTTIFAKYLAGVGAPSLTINREDSSFQINEDTALVLDHYDSVTLIRNNNYSTPNWVQWNSGSSGMGGQVTYIA